MFPREFGYVRVGPDVNHEIVLFPFDVPSLDLGLVWPALKEYNREHGVKLLKSSVEFRRHICRYCESIHQGIGIDQGAWCAPVLLHRPVSHNRVTCLSVTVLQTLSPDSVR